MQNNKKTETVVIIEQNEVYLQLYKDFLVCHRQYRILASAHDGMKGLALIQKYKPDVIILGYDLPRLSGVEALSQLSRIVPSYCPKVFLTASKNIHEEVESAATQALAGASQLNNIQVVPQAVYRLAEQMGIE